MMMMIQWNVYWGSKRGDYITWKVIYRGKLNRNRFMIHTCIKDIAFIIFWVHAVTEKISNFIVAQFLTYESKVKKKCRVEFINKSCCVMNEFLNPQPLVEWYTYPRPLNCVPIQRGALYRSPFCRTISNIPWNLHNCLGPLWLWPMNNGFINLVNTMIWGMMDMPYLCKDWKEFFNWEFLLTTLLCGSHFLA